MESFPQHTATPTSARTPETERRKAVRYRCMRECSVRVEGMEENGDWPGMSYNISRTGIAIALPFPAREGATLTIQFLGRKRMAPVQACVVRSQMQAFVWFHGARFLTPLEDDELKAWLS